MDTLRQYLLSVTAAAIICGIVNSLLGKKGTIGAIGKLLAGLFLSVTVISPWAKIQIEDISDFTNNISIDAEDAVQTGKLAASEALAKSIKSQTEAYILDKAAALEVSITVDVTLSDSDPPVPCAAHIRGPLSPYAKTRLSAMLETELGIPKEAQTWTG